AEKVFNQDQYFKRTVKFVGEPMTHLESIASSAVRAAIKVKASVIICFTSSGRAARPSLQTQQTSPVLKVALDHGKASGVVKSHDRVVVCQKVGDASVVKIIELED
ncbi:pyruvate kinase cytosolic isozyme, partial [Phtheirospermum japonicum]